MITEQRSAAILAFILAQFVMRAMSETIIYSYSPGGSGGCIAIYNGQGYRMGWTQADTYDGVNICAKLNSEGVAGQTGRAYLTTRIGPGTSVANEIASTNFTFPLQSTNLVLFEGLHLPAGSYYLSIIGDSSSGSCWESDNKTGNVITGAGVSSLGGFGVAGGMNSYFPASPIYADSTIPPELTVRGTDLNHPTLKLAANSNSVVIKWSTNSAGFVLESVNALNSTNWQTTTQTPITDSTNFVFMTNVTDVQFYRLSKQTN